MSPPIQLSLAGDGRLVILTAETVRKAFFQFTKVNPEYTGREKYRLNQPLHNPVELSDWRDSGQGKKITLLDSLHRPNIYKVNHIYPSARKYKQQRLLLDKQKILYLHPQDIIKVERQINKYILNHGLALVENEGKILEGSVNCQQAGQNRRKVKYIIRYGMYFILEPISRQTMIKMRDVDLFVQERETYDFHLIRYHGILLSSLKSRIRLSFCDRLNFSRSWTCTLDEFNPRQNFRVIEIYPCEGFCLVS